MRAFYTVLLSLSLLQRKVILKFPGNLFLCILPCWRRIHNCQIESFRRQTCPLARVGLGASELICDYEQGRGRKEIDDGVECKEAASCRSFDSMSGGERGSLRLVLVLTIWSACFQAAISGTSNGHRLSQSIPMT